jgi:hypothetical protein
MPESSRVMSMRLKIESDFSLELLSEFPTNRMVIASMRVRY